MAIDVFYSHYVKVFSFYVAAPTFVSFSLTWQYRRYYDPYRMLPSWRLISELTSAALLLNAVVRLKRRGKCYLVGK